MKRSDVPSVQEALSALLEYYQSTCNSCVWMAQDLHRLVDSARAAIASASAEWLNGDDYEYEFAYCSKCGHMEFADWDSHKEAKEKVGEYHVEHRYCSWCGAKMEGGRYVEKRRRK